MPLPISDIIYTYPTPPDFTGGEQPVSIKELKKWFDVYFSNTTGKFLTIRDNLLSDLNKIFGTNIELSETNHNKYDHIKISNFVSQYADDCIEAVNAYKFYGNKIVNEINKLTDYIKQAKDLLDKWDNLNTNNLSDQAVSDLIHKDVVDLECLMKYSLEIEEEFSTRYVYDFDEDNWKTADDDYSTDALNDSFNNSQIKTKTDYGNLDNLRATGVKCDRKGEDVDPKPLECFNELNLLDRLKYIKVYYDITKGKTDYIFPNNPSYGLPCVEETDNPKTKYIANIEKFYLGYLIDRDGPVNAFAGFFEMKVKAIEASIGIKQEELRAYNAYLNFINRGFDMLNSSQANGHHRICDGAITALTYLCGQEMYKLFTDASGKEFLVIPSIEHSGKFFLIPNDKYGMQFLLGDDGTANDYRGNSSVCLPRKSNNLFVAGYYDYNTEDFPEAPTSTEEAYAYKGKYYCKYTWKKIYGRSNERVIKSIEAEKPENIKNYYTSSNEFDSSKKTIEIDLYVREAKRTFNQSTWDWDVVWSEWEKWERATNNFFPFRKYSIDGNSDFEKKEEEIIKYENSCYIPQIGTISGTFTLPDELEVMTVNPQSAYNYSYATSSAWDGKTEGHVEWAAVIESWTNAFQTKLKYIDVAVKTTETDIQTLRDTINTYESLTKTLRSRTHDAGLNVVNKLVS